ncbi:Crp/Fnr family transcriptional regulator [Pedobacter sp. N36a]|uniref:Crp/Fnr family transcriptional regulator n=2 Tax=unclassified Pedobacter TaxID=2628915 RepID=UPI001656D787|nr:Crp/Fnr family transcriptional regulator [Pedobacter sp. N36a]MBC8986674.1 Crp/Fnr family transcriptional regulator [Pedobacter sp. N36a]
MISILQKVTPMDIDFMLTTLGFITPLSQQLQERFTAQIQQETIRKRTILLRQGETCRRIYFIKEGFARCYFLDKQGKECTTWFFNEGDFMISVHSFYTQKPAYENIEILEDCILQSISWLQIQAIYADTREGNHIGRVMSERYQIQSEERFILHRDSNPTERYKLLLEHYPGIEQKTTQTNIASYLGISRETLCRLKGKKLRCDINQKNSF